MRNASTLLSTAKKEFRFSEWGKRANMNFTWAAIYFFKAMSEQVDTKANCLCIMHSDAAVIISKILHGLESLELIEATGRLLDVLIRAMTDAFSNLKEMSGWLFHGSRIVEFLQLGVSSNWFGLACPHHCYPSALSSLALAFILGFCCGFSFAICLGFWAYQFLFQGQPSSSQGFRSPPGSRLSRLQGYLHERGPHHHS